MIKTPSLCYTSGEVIRNFNLRDCVLIAIAGILPCARTHKRSMFSLYRSLRDSEHFEYLVYRFTMKTGNSS